MTKPEYCPPGKHEPINVVTKDAKITDGQGRRHSGVWITATCEKCGILLVKNEFK